MKYIIFVALLAYVKAVPYLTALTEYVEATHADLNHLNNSIGALISTLNKKVSIILLREHRMSLRTMITEYIHFLPQREESLRVYRDCMKKDLPKTIFTIFTNDLNRPEKAQDHLHSFLKAATAFINEASNNAQIVIPNADPSSQELIYRMAWKAVTSAQKAVQNLFTALVRDSDLLLSIYQDHVRLIFRDD